MFSNDVVNLPSLLLNDVTYSAGPVGVATTFSVDRQLPFLSNTDTCLVIQLLWKQQHVDD